MRVFYVVLGATAGVLLVRRITRAAQSWTPEGMTNRVGMAISDFVEDVRDGMAEREADLREALGIDAAPPQSAPAE